MTFSVKKKEYFPWATTQYPWQPFCCLCETVVTLYLIKFSQGQLLVPILPYLLNVSFFICIPVVKDVIFSKCAENKTSNLL